MGKPNEQEISARRALVFAIQGLRVFLRKAMVEVSDMNGKCPNAWLFIIREQADTVWKTAERYLNYPTDFEGVNKGLSDGLDQLLLGLADYKSIKKAEKMLKKTELMLRERGWHIE